MHYMSSTRVTLMPTDSNSTVEVHSASYSGDTGAYKCVAASAAGQAQDVATVFIETANVPDYDKGNDRNSCLSGR